MMNQTSPTVRITNAIRWAGHSHRRAHTHAHGHVMAFEAARNTVRLIQCAAQHIVTAIGKALDRAARSSAACFFSLLVFPFRPCSPRGPSRRAEAVKRAVQHKDGLTEANRCTKLERERAKKNKPKWTASIRKCNFRKLLHESPRCALLQKREKNHSTDIWREGTSTEPSVLRPREGQRRTAGHAPLREMRHAPQRRPNLGSSSLDQIHQIRHVAEQ